MQKEATVRSSVLEVLLEITKYSDLYLMERVVDDESEVSNNFFSIQCSFSIIIHVCTLLSIINHDELKNLGSGS